MYVGVRFGSNSGQNLLNRFCIGVHKLNANLFENTLRYISATRLLLSVELKCNTSLSLEDMLFQFAWNRAAILSRTEEVLVFSSTQDGKFTFVKFYCGSS